MDPKGKVALITGGARIGQAVAQALAARGCALALTYRGSRAAAEETASAAKAAGVPAIALRADATDETPSRCRRDRDRAIARAARHPGQHGLDLREDTESERCRLVRRAGRQRQERVSLRDPCGADHEGTRRRPHHQRQRLAARQRTPTLQGLYALLRLQGRCRRANRKLGARAGARDPRQRHRAGPILAPPDLTPEQNTRVIDAVPLNRWGGAEEIAKAVLFLVETDFVTGECIRVDGGRHLY